MVAALPGLHLSVDRRVKSLGSALGAGKVRNAKVMRKRLAAFKVRKHRFWKLRLVAGARRNDAGLRTGGTAALVLGHGTMGVSNSLLLSQRQAVAAASVLSGARDVDLTLIMAVGSGHGKADPAFAAHEAAIGSWAQAAWSKWLSRAALARIAAQAASSLQGSGSFWAKVKGPAAAMAASAARLCWRAVGSTQSMTLAVTLTSPEIGEVEKSVRRWRGTNVEQKVPTHAGVAGLSCSRSLFL